MMERTRKALCDTERHLATRTIRDLWKQMSFHLWADLLPVILARLPSVSGLMGSKVWYYRSGERITGTAAQVATVRSEPQCEMLQLFLSNSNPTQGWITAFRVKQNSPWRNMQSTFLASLVLLLVMNLCGLRPQVRDEHVLVLACHSYELFFAV